MKNWEEKVSKIELKELVSFSNKYDYIACFDENGTASSTIQMYKSLMKNETPDENRRYFTLTCCLFSKEEYEFADNLINDLKNDFFKEEKDSIVLHTREISKKLGPYNFKNTEKYNCFIEALTETINYVNCKIISVTFDLYAYVKQGYSHDPYQVAFDIILEGLFRIVKQNSKTALVFEARGKNEDKALFKHIYKILNITGTKRIKKETLRKRFGNIYFNHKISINHKNLYTGIEIADLCSYPIYRYMRFKTEGRDYLVVKNKVAKYQNGRYFGVRHFPKVWENKK